MDAIAQKLAINEDLTGYTQEQRSAHNAEVQALRDALNRYQNHVKSMSSAPVDDLAAVNDVALILAHALEADGQPGVEALVDAVATACYDVDQNELGARLEDLAHDNLVKRLA